MRKRLLSFTLIGIGIGFGFSIFLTQVDALAPAANAVYLARIQGTINPASSSYLLKTIQEAERNQAEAVIVELDTPGGLLSSVREMAQAIDGTTVPIIFYVAPAGASATSAGALLMIASHLAAMAPGTNIGAAHPVGAQGEDIQGKMGEKAVNDTAAFARGMAELRGRNRDAAEAIVSKSRSFTAEEALHARLIDAVANDREHLLEQFSGRTVRLLGRTRTLQLNNAGIKTIEMTEGQKLLHLLANPNIAAILMSLGLLLIYVELSNPGITVAGILGGISLLIAFMAFQLIPIHSGALALMALGILLLAAEPFVTSNGALAAGGVLCFVLGMIWVTDRSLMSLAVSPSVWIPLTLALGSGAAVITWAAARTKKLAKQARSRIGGGASAGLTGYLGHVQSIYQDGFRGKAVFRGEVWDFESTTPLQPGDTVEAMAIEEMRVRVKKASSGK